MNYRNRLLLASLCALFATCSGALSAAQNYPIVDTGQERAYDNRFEITYPGHHQPFFGQDAQYQGDQPAYRDNRDGTVTDLVTGLMWQQDPGPKKTLSEAIAAASACRLGGYDDWRLPSIKELYSLILFSGEDVDPNATRATNLKPFIDTRFFHFAYGDPSKGERIIDSQAATSTKYVSTTMRGNETMFGVNFADGRIKGYPARIGHRGPAKYYVFYVRGNSDYGHNKFHDNGDGTITDRATGLCWAKVDSGHLRAGEGKDGKLNWEQALRWAEELEYAGYSDWRLPNAKELQSIVDYTRSPDTTNSAAIDPMFQATPVRDALGKLNYGFYWTGTTHKRAGAGDTAVYIAFGRSQGWMPGPGGRRVLLDVHGAGSQRSDPKAGDPARFPFGRGPQGDVIGIYNLVRPVRDDDVSLRERGPKLQSPGRTRSRQTPRPATAPPARPNRGRVAPFLQRFDRNRDGRVTREEFNGVPRRFSTLDLDGDGVVSCDEALQAGPPDAARHRSARPGRRDSAARDQSQRPNPDASRIR